jgi:hypothetical protein
MTIFVYKKSWLAAGIIVSVDDLLVLLLFAWVATLKKMLMIEIFCPAAVIDRCCFYV